MQTETQTETNPNTTSAGQVNAPGHALPVDSSKPGFAAKTLENLAAEFRERDGGDDPVTAVVVVVVSAKSAPCAIASGKPMLVIDGMLSGVHALATKYIERMAPGLTTRMALRHLDPADVVRFAAAFAMAERESGKMLDEMANSVSLKTVVERLAGLAPDEGEAKESE